MHLAVVALGSDTAFKKRILKVYLYRFEGNILFQIGRVFCPQVLLDTIQSAFSPLCYDAAHILKVCFFPTLIYTLQALSTKPFCPLQFP